MYFNRPEALLLLILIVPLSLVTTWLQYSQLTAIRRQWGEAGLAGSHASAMSIYSFFWRGILITAGLSFLVLALARPSLDKGTVEFPQGTTDIILLVDASRSMAAMDYHSQAAEINKGKSVSKDSHLPWQPASQELPFHGTRLDMARYLINEKIIPLIGANRVGAVTYAGDVMPLAFLTTDVHAFDWANKRALNIGSAFGEDSCVQKAFQCAFHMFDADSTQNHRQIILLFSDGGLDEKEGLAALQPMLAELKQRRIELFVFGMGSTTPSAIPLNELPWSDRITHGPAPGPGQQFWTDEQGVVVTSQLEENNLRIIANSVGGKYVRVRSAADFDFKVVTRRFEMKKRPGRQEFFLVPLGIAALLISAGWLCTARRAQSSNQTAS